MRQHYDVISQRPPQVFPEGSRRCILTLNHEMTLLYADPTERLNHPFGEHASKALTPVPGGYGKTLQIAAAPVGSCQDRSDKAALVSGDKA